MNNTIYDIPDSVNTLFENITANNTMEYRIVDYSINGMDNNASMSYFLEQLFDFESKHMQVNDGTQVILQHEDFTFLVQIDSSGGGDFFSHNFDAQKVENN